MQVVDLQWRLLKSLHYSPLFAAFVYASNSRLWVMRGGACSGNCHPSCDKIIWWSFSGCVLAPKHQLFARVRRGKMDVHHLHRRELFQDAARG